MKYWLLSPLYNNTPKLWGTHKQIKLRYDKNKISKLRIILYKKINLYKLTIKDTPNFGFIPFFQQISMGK